MLKESVADAEAAKAASGGSGGTGPSPPPPGPLSSLSRVLTEDSRSAVAVLSVPSAEQGDKQLLAPADVQRARHLMALARCEWGDSPAARAARHALHEDVRAGELELVATVLRKRNVAARVARAVWEDAASAAAGTARYGVAPNVRIDLRTRPDHAAPRTGWALQPLSEFVATAERVNAITGERWLRVGGSKKKKMEKEEAAGRGGGESGNPASGGGRRRRRRYVQASGNAQEKRRQQAPKYRQRAPSRATRSTSGICVRTLGSACAFEASLGRGKETREPW